MNYFKKISKILPFIVLLILSLVLLTLAYWVKDNFIKNIVSNMAATSIYALVAIFTYDRVKHFSNREKTSELRNYAQSEIDPQIMAILISISKLIYSRNEYPETKKIGSELEKLTKELIVTKIKNREYLGFDIFRNSDETTKNIKKLLENSFLRPLIDDDLVLVLIKLTNRLEKLYQSLAKPENLVKTNKPKASEYKIFGSREISSYNISYPNRKLLVKKIPHKDGMGVVEQFADFPPRIDEKILLSFYIIKETKVNTIASNILEVLNLIKKWVKSR